MNIKWSLRHTTWTGDHGLEVRSMQTLRITLFAGVVAAVLTSIAPAHAQQMASPPAAGAHDFDFLVGEWRVHHRRLKPGGHEWVQFEGTCSNRALMDGSANMEEHALDAPGGAYHAVALRAYDSKAGQWAIWWLDGRYPSGPLDPPMKGRFENGVGRFYSDYTQDGKPMRVRFLWSDITTISARWEQATSSDGGTTWEPNWIMSFQREAAGATQAAEPTDASDFDFLRGDWRVHHRYLRVKDERREWTDVDGTASLRPVMGGRANVEEHTIDAPGGAYRAVALRSYDPDAPRWSIWWLDGRAPHGDLDPPVQGRFENGAGAFYGDTTVDGAPIRVRFIWSGIASASPRWEQAYSSDAGKTWDTNWTMEFRRVP
jgi:hypothetical protein